jgi:hypothetical protein
MCLHRRHRPRHRRRSNAAGAPAGQVRVLSRPYREGVSWPALTRWPALACRPTRRCDADRNPGQGGAMVPALAVLAIVFALGF